MPIYNCSTGGSKGGSSGGGPTYSAGDGISIGNNVISVRISTEQDNATGIVNGALYTSIPRPSAVYPLVQIRTVPATPNAQITGQKGTLTVQGQTDSNGVAEITVTAFGVWTFSGTVGGALADVTVAVSESRLYEVALSPINVFGVSWAKNNPSTALTRLTPQSDPNHYVTVEVKSEPSPAIGTGSGSSPFDSYAPWSGMYICNLGVDGSETARQGDGDFSFSKQEVMVYIPQFYYKIVETDNIRYFYIADHQINDFALHPGSGFYVSRYVGSTGYHSVTATSPLVNLSLANVRTNIRAIGTNWDSYDVHIHNAISLLYLIEYADWNSQNKIGRGVVDGSGSVQNGETDTMIYHTGRAAGTDGRVSIQYRGLENVWGNIWIFTDGAILQNHILYICTDPEKYSSSSTADYVALNSNVTQNFIGSLAYNEDYAYMFVMDGAGGSGTTYISDYAYIGSGSGMFTYAVGGRNGFGDNCGLFATTSNTIGSAYNVVGFKTVYRPAVQGG